MNTTYTDYLYAVLEQAFVKLETERARTFEQFKIAEDGSDEEQILHDKMVFLKKSKRHVVNLMLDIDELRELVTE